MPRDALTLSERKEWIMRQNAFALKVEDLLNGYAHAKLQARLARKAAREAERESRHLGPLKASVKKPFGA